MCLEIRQILDGDMSKIPAYIIGDSVKEITLSIADMTPEEGKLSRQDV